MRTQANTGGAAPPSTEIFLSFPSATKPIYWPSGEKQGSAALWVPERSVGVA
jgi:hypothetical protein